MERKRRQADDFTNSINSFRFSHKENKGDTTEDNMQALSNSSIISGYCAVPLSYRPVNSPIMEQTVYTQSDEDTSKNVLEQTICEKELNNTSTSTAYISLYSGKNDIKANDAKKDETFINDSSTSNDALHSKSKNSFVNILSTLINRINQAEDIVTDKQAVEYLSQTFSSSPQKFTNELLTIIEESVINNSIDYNLDSSKVAENIDRFIADESMPSFINDELCNMEATELGDKTTRNLCSPLNTPNRRPLSTPLSTFNRRIKKVYRKTPVRIFQNRNNPENISPSDMDSTYNFELLETQVNSCFPNERTGEKASVSEVLPRITIADIQELRKIVNRQLESLYDNNELVLSEIKKKREECFNTTELEINSNLSQDDIYVASNDERFWKTLKSCRQYFSYLDEHKPLLTPNRNQEHDLPSSDFNLNVKKCSPNKFVKTKTTLSSQTNTKTFLSKKSTSKVMKTLSPMAPDIIITPCNLPKRTDASSQRKKHTKVTYFTSPKKKPIKPFQSPKRNFQRGSKYKVASPVAMYIQGLSTLPKENIEDVKKKMFFSPEDNDKKKAHSQATSSKSTNGSSRSMRKTKS